MVKKITAVFMIMALSGLSALPVYAARNITKSFKVSVTLPSIVNLPAKDSLNKTETVSTASMRQITEETVMVRNNEKILLRTIVVQ